VIESFTATPRLQEDLPSYRQSGIPAGESSDLIDILQSLGYCGRRTAELHCFTAFWASASSGTSANTLLANESAAE